MVSPEVVEAVQSLGAVALDTVDVVGPVADVGLVVEEEAGWAHLLHRLPVVAVVEGAAVGRVGHVGETRGTAHVLRKVICKLLSVSQPSSHPASYNL